MRWVKDGPDIPIEIIQAVEDGKVVFFCGAGVSQQAGLPGYGGLVDAVYARLQRNPDTSPAEKLARERKEYDQVFTALEMAINDPRLVRRHVVEALEIAKDADTGTHAALIRLGTDRDGRCRIVTTNYDRCFAPYVDLANVDAAPRLPVPNPSRWKSLVHLHGALACCGTDWNDLVLSSADFGAAYLIDGWATRFLRELFRNFMVLFVGYSADDVAVKYMLQALAMDLNKRGSAPRAYALAPTDGDEQQTRSIWKARGIEPILYADDGAHGPLHGTLRTWAEYSGLGLLARRRIVGQRLSQAPANDRDEVIGQVLWALRDKNGATAEYVAGLEADASPSPTHWLRVLDADGLFSLERVPLILPFGAVGRPQPLHPISFNLGRWLVRHLNEETLLDWALEKGGTLHVSFAAMVKDALEKTTELSPEVRKAWRFLAFHRPENGLGQWENPRWLANRVSAGEWNHVLRSEVLAAMQPCFVLSRDRIRDAFRSTENKSDGPYPVDVEIRFAGGMETDYLIASIRKRTDVDVLLASLLDDCTSFVRRSLEVREYFDLASPDEDWTYIELKSIDPRASGHAGHKLAPFISLIAACVDASSRVNPALARSQVEYWKTLNYPVFRRLVCYAMTLPKLFGPNEILCYVMSDYRVLWRYNSESELRKLLAFVWPSLNGTEQVALVQRLLAGPPEDLYRSDLSPEELSEAIDTAIASRLAVLEAAGSDIPSEAAQFLEHQRKRRRSDPIPTSEGESTGTSAGSSEFLDLLRRDISPAIRDSQYLANIVRADIGNAIEAFKLVSEEGLWPVNAWRAAIDCIATLIVSGTMNADVGCFLDLIAKAPDGLRDDAIASLARLVSYVPKATELIDDKVYWWIWDMVFDALRRSDLASTDTLPSLTEAKNTPEGHLVDGLFEWVGKQEAAATADPFWERLALVCLESSRLGDIAREAAAIRLAWLHSVRPEWVQVTLIPFFAWNRPERAKWVWTGFLFRAHFIESLWELLSEDFVATFDRLQHFEKEATRVLYQMVGWIAVEQPKWLAADVAQRIVTRAAHNARQQVAWVFWRALDAAENRAASLWRERVGPWLESCWQPDEEMKDSATADTLIRAALLTGEAFPEAVECILPRISAMNQSEQVIWAVSGSKVHELFPEAAVSLLDRTVSRSEQFYLGELKALLKTIAERWNDAEGDRRFRDLSDFAGT